MVAAIAAASVIVVVVVVVVVVVAVVVVIVVVVAAVINTYQYCSLTICIPTPGSGAWHVVVGLAYIEWHCAELRLCYIVFIIKRCQ